MEAVNNLLRQVLVLHHAGRPDLFKAEGKKYTDEELKDIFSNPDTPVFVYEEKGEALGYAFCAIQHQESGSLMPLTTLYIDDICVDEKYERAVVQELLQFSRLLGSSHAEQHIVVGTDTLLCL